MKATERRERLAMLQEVKKWDDADLFEWALSDPASPETHIATPAVQAIEAEIGALE